VRSQKPRDGDTRAKVLPAGVTNPADHPTAGKITHRPMEAAARRSSGITPMAPEGGSASTSIRPSPAAMRLAR
jgi:hypothetical protein